MTDRATRRRVLTVAALVAGALAISAVPAGATEGPDHICGAAGFLHLDNGPLTDVIHHNVEPLVPELQDPLHETSCALTLLLEDDFRPGGVDDLLSVLLG